MGFGFIGLGAMGAPMAAQVLAGGHELVVFDVRHEAVADLVERGAQEATSPRDVANACEVVIASLPTPAASLDVLTGDRGLRGGDRMTTFVELSTIGRPTARRCAALLAEAGASYVDAPVSGGVTGARKGTLTVMAAGAADAVARAMPALDAIGSSVIVVGRTPGQAQIVKLANNLLSASAIVVSAEAVLMAVKAGVDPRVAVEIISRSTGANTAITDKFPRCVLPRTFDSQFRLDLLVKDVRLCVEASTELRSPMLVGGQIEALLSLAGSQLPDDADSLDVIRFLEEWAGARVDDESWKQLGDGDLEPMPG